MANIHQFTVAEIAIVIVRVADYFIDLPYYVEEAESPQTPVQLAKLKRRTPEL
ncbi:hypothetical protein [Pseudanabaena sp. PCC 6802]|uniref:hypothetical protein n=1 Tax=Pseudanabaena sp. PCC 6802 TaxID=118173 RepID=UPI0012EA01F7|nr:hypothetical protein [Pseudanabaena sp. PCC 6802]